MGPNYSANREDKRSLHEENATFSRLLEEEVRQAIDIRGHPSPEQTLSLLIYDWQSCEPQVQLVLDDRPFSGPFEDIFDEKEESLEIRFRLSDGYHNSISSLKTDIEEALTGQNFLGATTMHTGAIAVRKCMDDLRRARKRRPQWSDPRTIFNAEYRFMRRSTESRSLYFKTVVDEEERSVIIVNESSSVFKDEMGCDVVSPNAIPLACLPGSVGSPVG